MDLERYCGLSEQDYQEVVRALEIWASTHPKKNDPIIMLMGRTFTPRQFVAEVKDCSEFGRSFLDYLRRQSSNAGEHPTKFIDRAIRANELR